MTLDFEIRITKKFKKNEKKLSLLKRQGKLLTRIFSLLGYKSDITGFICTD